MFFGILEQLGVVEKLVTPGKIKGSPVEVH